MESFVVAVAQSTPLFLDRDGTIDRACALITEAGRSNARLILFPECYVPCYPLWAWFIPAGRTQELRALYAELIASSITVGDDACDRLRNAAREARVNVAIGINERNREASGGSLYNSLLMIDEEGTIRGCHRKLVPTVGERLIHAAGDGSTLEAWDLAIGRVGALVCWENYMPLARYALYAWGTEIHLAPTWDRGEPWLSTIRHIAKEGRVHLLSACIAMHRDDIPDRYAFKSLLPDVAWLNPGESAIVDPDGKFVVEPVREREALLLAEIDPARWRGSRYQLDVAGHYGRPDVFELKVNRSPRPMVSVVEPAVELDGSIVRE